jgi:hypothetical protein
VDQLDGLVDAVAGGGDDDPLAGEATQVDLLVCGDDDGRGAGDGGVRQLVLDADGPVGLNVHGVAELLGRLLEALGGHIGVRHARWAGGDAYEVFGI